MVGSRNVYVLLNQNGREIMSGEAVQGSESQGKAVNVAIVGATGAVGVEFLHCLEIRNFPLGGLRLFASGRSAGKRMSFKGESLAVEKLSEDSFHGTDIALFPAGSSVSKQFAASVVSAGCVVIDNSSAFRMNADVPLVVSEVNRHALA
ncbi:MAG: unnamed protein product [uncultured Caballeronia sp.]|nr:MAG: unnamed protein product [uncultured Caballeronia sp.]